MPGKGEGTAAILVGGLPDPGLAIGSPEHRRLLGSLGAMVPILIGNLDAGSTHEHIR
jgi:hypothetical protein